MSNENIQRAVQAAIAGDAAGLAQCVTAELDTRRAAAAGEVQSAQLQSLFAEPEAPAAETDTGQE